MSSFRTKRRRLCRSLSSSLSINSVLIGISDTSSLFPISILFSSCLEFMAGGCGFPRNSNSSPSAAALVRLLYFSFSLSPHSLIFPLRRSSLIFYFDPPDAVSRKEREFLIFCFETIIGPTLRLLDSDGWGQTKAEMNGFAKFVDSDSVGFAARLDFFSLKC